MAYGAFDQTYEYGEGRGSFVRARPRQILKKKNSNKKKRRRNKSRRGDKRRFYDE